MLRIDAAMTFVEVAAALNRTAVGRGVASRRYLPTHAQKDFLIF
jgi:hypothetical protein